MLDWITQPWPWYVSGPLLALVMVSLLFNGGEFGVSSTLRTVCTIGGAGKSHSFFDFDWKSQIWNIIFVSGAIIGGFIASQFLIGYDYASGISERTFQDLSALGIQGQSGALPSDLISWSSLATFEGFLIIVGGGFLVGFGARYAGGCTSGHAISGLSNLQLPSLIAVIGFFIGGLIMTHFFMPLLLN